MRIKKAIIKASLILVMLFFAWNGLSAPAQASDSWPSIKVDDSFIAFDSQVHPLIEGQRTLVPFRKIAEALGAKVEWIDTTRTVIFVKPGKIIELTIGDPQARVNGKDCQLDTPPRIVNDSTLVPLRFVGENLDAVVNWSGDTRTITITTIEGAAIGAPTGNDTGNLPGNATGDTPGNTTGNTKEDTKEDTQETAPDARPGGQTESQQQPVLYPYAVAPNDWRLTYPDANGQLELVVNFNWMQATDREYSLLIGTHESPRLVYDAGPKDDPYYRDKYFGEWKAADLGLSPGNYECRVITWSKDKKTFSKNSVLITIPSSKLSLSYPMSDPSRWLVFASQAESRIDPIFAGRLAKFAEDHGRKIEMVDGKRSYQNQVSTYTRRGGYFNKKTGQWEGGYGAAAPGTSWHEFGEAVDVGSSWVKNMGNVNVERQQMFLDYGLCKPLTNGNNYDPPENWHLQPVETLGINSYAARASFLEAYGGSR
ncbi:MAG: hypothetical protein HPY50_18845 [Firmicutes bacterium]|nr:hypothetical protein [Bacillota bacterium]